MTLDSFVHAFIYTHFIFFHTKRKGFMSLGSLYAMQFQQEYGLRIGQYFQILHYICISNYHAFKNNID